MHPFDTTVFHALNRGAANRALDMAFPILTSLHQRWWFWAILGVAALAAIRRGSAAARWAVVAAILAVSITDITAARVVKRVIKRERPCHVVPATGRKADPEARVIAGSPCPGSPSFPSNHAANQMALGTVCWYFTQGRRRWLWFLLPLVVGYTRVYLGFHYPTDLVGGWALGAAVAAAVLAGIRPLALRTSTGSAADDHHSSGSEAQASGSGSVS